MSRTGQSRAERVRLRALAWLDALTFAVVTTVAAFLAAGVLSVASGGGTVRVKLLLFLFGWVLMAYAVVRLWPSNPRVDEAKSPQTGASLSKTHELRAQRLARRLPPVRWVTLPPPERRVRVPMQIFLTSVFVLGFSFLLETGFGVQ
jgi:hypothetical protein